MARTIEFLPASLGSLGPLATWALSQRPQCAHLGLRLPARAEQVPAPADPDPELCERVEWVAALRAAAEPHLRGLARDESREGIAAALGRAAQDGTPLVVVGHQPVLAGGALLEAVKTLAGLRLARDLERHLARPVVCVFWNHGDDHDAAEAAGIHLINPNLDVAKVGLASLGSGRVPLDRIQIHPSTHGLAGLQASLMALLPEKAPRRELFERFLPRPGETLVEARTRLWLDLFGAHGLLVLEPRRLAGAHGRALARLVGSGAARGLDGAAARLSRCPVPVPPLDPERAPALLYALEGGKRRAARPIPGGGWRLDGEPEGAERTGEELAARVRAQPESFTAGALWRPLVQDLCLPVAAYVGGPGELAYLAWTGEMRDLSGVPNTPFVLRSSVFFSTPQLRAAAARTPHAVRSYLEDKSLLIPTKTPESPEPVLDQLAATLQRHRRELLDLREALALLDRGLAQQLRRAADQGADLVEKIRTKAARVSSNRDGTSRRHLRRLSAFLWPRDQPQERILALLGLVAAAGEGWIAELLEELDPFPSEVLLAHLPGPTEGWW